MHWSKKQNTVITVLVHVVEGERLQYMNIYTHGKYITYITLIQTVQCEWNQQGLNNG